MNFCLQFIKDMFFNECISSAKSQVLFFQKYSIGILDKTFHFKHSLSFCFKFHSSYAWNFACKVGNGTKKFSLF